MCDIIKHLSMVFYLPKHQSGLSGAAMASSSHSYRLQIGNKLSKIAHKNKEEENKSVLPEQFVNVVLFVDSWWPIECKFSQSCINGTIHSFYHVRDNEETRSIETMRTMNANVFQWMLFHECINNFNE